MNTTASRPASASGSSHNTLASQRSTTSTTSSSSSGRKHGSGGLQAPMMFPQTTYTSSSGSGLLMNILKVLKIKLYIYC